MSDETFTPEENALIERLRAAPQRHLSSRTAEAIRQRMLRELASASGLPVQPRPALRLPVVLRLAAAAALLILIVGGGLLLARLTQPNILLTTLTPAAQIAADASLTPTLPATDTPEPLPTATVTLTITPPPTDVPGSTPSWTPSASATLSIAQPSITPMPLIPTVTATTASAAAPIIIVEGMVEGVEENLIRVFGLSIEVEPGHPVLSLIAEGDVLRIEGSLGDNGRLVASVIDTLREADTATAGATVGLDGPVEAINANIVTVNGIAVAFDPSAALLRTLRVGDFVSIEGNFEQREGAFVLVVVTAETVEPGGDGIAGVPSACVYEDTGMGMGRWRCDTGMGMGMGAMGMEGMSGMGDGMGGMGMGN